MIELTERKLAEMMEHAELMTGSTLTSEPAPGQISCSQHKLEASNDVLLTCFQELLQFSEIWLAHCCHRKLNMKLRYCFSASEDSVSSEGSNLQTYIYMDVVVDLDVVLCIPHGHGSDEVRLGLCCQLQVPFNVVLNDWKPFPGYFSTAHANRQTASNVLHPTETYQPHEVPMFPVLRINCSIKYTTRSRTAMWQSKSF